MLKRMKEISDKELRAQLHKAYVTSPCQAPYLNEAGENFRLEHKPAKTRLSHPRHPERVRQFVTAQGHEIATEAKDGGYFVKVPLGTHGADHLGIDPETGRIGCCLCQEKK